MAMPLGSSLEGECRGVVSSNVRRSRRRRALEHINHQHLRECRELLAQHSCYPRHLILMLRSPSPCADGHPLCVLQRRGLIGPEIKAPPKETPRKKAMFQNERSSVVIKEVLSEPLREDKGAPNAPRADAVSTKLMNKVLD